MKKNEFVLAVLILVIGSIFFNSCSRGDDSDDDLLGASKPNYNMLSDITVVGLYTTQWVGKNDSISLIIDFDRVDCNFNYTVSSSGKRTVSKYKYTYKHPTVTLTPEDDNDGALIGTTKLGGIKASDKMSFVDADGSNVLFTVIRKK